MAIIFYGILSESLVIGGIDRWIHVAGEPVVFCEKDENIGKFQTKLLGKYEVLSLDKALERYPDADIWVTYPKAAGTRNHLLTKLSPSKLHFLEDYASEAVVRELCKSNPLESGSLKTPTYRPSLPEGGYPKIPNITPEFLSMIKLPDEKCKKLNYLLVMPVMPRMASFTFTFQVGIAYISSALKASGRNLFTLNLDLDSTGNPYELLKKEIINNKIDVVMTGGVNSQYRNLKRIIDTAKKATPNIVTVVGGIIVTADPSGAMEALKTADYGIVGEGEISINALAYALETDSAMSDVEGVVFRQDGQWMVNGDSPAVSDLGILPYPDYEGFEYRKYLDIAKGQEKRAFINTSRSCVNKCSFCFSKHGKYRRLPIDDVFKQIDWMLSTYPDIRRLHLGDELSFSNPAYAIEFSNRIKPYNLSWRAAMRVDRINREMLVAMKDSGCKQILIGIESADNDVLKSMRKGITIEQVEKAIGYANEIGISMLGFLIFGDPAETMESALRSIKWYMKHKKNVGGMVVIRIDPGSHLYEVACEKGFITDRAEYIKQYKLSGSRLINLSKLTDLEFEMLPHLLDAVSKMQE